ncbi:transposon Ty3-I Gag-Pol polyprotein [Nephila pilipes]|uniref:Transposon Ty3-I Gag-Pol polyprotein n=1 Tax=Nephila pilipes TaxID=299642 RepID=A0A8X6TPE5_NEPPI|nr:transposon Ty3-I Gag-Pol polyprotein [Nephila pilipes]
MDKRNRIKRSMKGSITKLETLVNERTVITDTSSIEIKVKLKKIENLQTKLNELHEKYEILDIRDIEKIESGLHDADNHLEEMERKNGLFLEGSIYDILCLMLVDIGANVILLRADLIKKLKEQTPNISQNTAVGEKAEMHGKLDVFIECGSKKFQRKVYVPDISDPCILCLDFIQKFNISVDFE